MPPPKRGVATKGRPDLREDEPSPASSPRRRGNETPQGRHESPSKAALRKPRTTEDVRAEASPIIPKGRGRPVAKKMAPVATVPDPLLDESPRRSRRNTEREQPEEALAPTPRSRTGSQSTSRKVDASPAMTPRRGRKQSEMTEPLDEPSETGSEVEGRGKRKRKLTEAAEAAQSQSRSRKSSRRVSERMEEREERMGMEEIGEMEEPIEEEEEGVMEEALDEVAHEELVHAVSPQEMHEQRALSMRGVLGGRQTRGMHVVTGEEEEEEMDEMGEEGIEEMVVYDDDGNMMIGYEGEEMVNEEVIEGTEEDELVLRHHEEAAAARHHMQQQQMQHVQQLQQAGQRRAAGKEMKEEPRPAADEDEDDDMPPRLEMEEGPNADEILLAESMERGQMVGETIEGYDEQGYYRSMSPGGTIQVHYEDEMYVEGVEGGVMQVMEDPAPPNDLRTVEFNFLDNKHICCGLCGEIVPYDLLLREHLPTHHPEVYGDGSMDLEEISYDSWLKDKLFHDSKRMENGFRSGGYGDQQGTSAMSRMGRNTRVLRRVSQVRVNPASMTLSQLDVALKKKMIEKMGRKVKVSLVDKQHARCGICNAVVSLNKKFEVIHLVRHFNAWHPSTHRCAGTWPNRATLMGPGKPLSSQDFAVVDVALDAPESLQCIWCGMFMDRTMLAMHFHEVHPDDVEVPKCHLCLQEIVINARLMEKFGEDFEITLPDEHHIKCHKIGSTFSTEAALDRTIDRRLTRMREVENGEQLPPEGDTEEGEEDEAVDPSMREPQYSNSRMHFGRRNKPKRNFIMPSLRQAIPQDSRYVESLSEGQWKCKLCNEPILAAVISAGAIKHYRLAHPEQVEDMQYELCKARLERVSDGCMEFVHPQLIECLICNLTYALHKPYNMCRGIRHLKNKHPEMMPEYNRALEQPQNVPVGKKGQYKSMYTQQQPSAMQRNAMRGIEMGEYVDDPEIISKLKQEYDIEFDKVQTMYGPDGEPIYVLVPDGEEVDERVAENIQASILEGGQGEEVEGVIVEGEEYQLDDMEEMVIEEEVGAEEEEGMMRGRHRMAMVEEEEHGHHEGHEGHEEGGHHSDDGDVIEHHDGDVIDDGHVIVEGVIEDIEGEEMVVMGEEVIEEEEEGH